MWNQSLYWIGGSLDNQNHSVAPGPVTNSVKESVEFFHTISRFCGNVFAISNILKGANSSQF